VSFVKIDVEGHELAVVKGGMQLIERERPVLVIESEERHHSGAPGEIMQLLIGLGFRALELRDGRLTEVRSPGERQSRNLVFVPADR
jgi:hypothetical protein